MAQADPAQAHSTTSPLDADRQRSECCSHSNCSETTLRTRIGFAVAVFITLSGLILSRPARPMLDFDQNFYVSIAYDLNKYGVYSNGVLGEVDSTVTRPPSGMFFGPVFPMLVFAVTELDPRFAEAVRCSIEANSGLRKGTTCKPDEMPIRLINVFLLAIGLFAVASAAQLIFRRRWMFLLSGTLGLIALACEANIFSYVMTEATIFSLYSMFAYATVLAWKTGHTRHSFISGVLLGLLCLTKPSFLIQFPLVAALTAVCLIGRANSRPHVLKHLVAFSLAFAILPTAWIVRNAISVGKFGFTEEYGAAALIERFAYNDMSLREILQAFPYCTPVIGELAFDKVGGRDSMHRFTYFTAGSFFNVGRDRRNALFYRYGRLDPQISGIALDELRTRWWHHLLVSIPLAWCGMWAGWAASLLLIPLFAWACIRSARTRPPLFLCYAAPALANLALDALIGNHYTRYNLILIGPYATGAAAIISSWLKGLHWRWRLRAPARLSIPSAPAASDEDSA